MSKRSRGGQRSSAGSVIASVILLIVFGTFLLIRLRISKRSSPSERIRRTVEKDPDFNLMAPLIVAQAQHESNRYTSRIFREDNNPFGMKYPTRRDTTAVGVDSAGYAIYPNIEEATRDLLQLFRYGNYMTVPYWDDAREDSAAAYAQELKRHGYYEDTIQNYTNGLKRFL